MNKMFIAFVQTIVVATSQAAIPTKSEIKNFANKTPLIVAVIDTGIDVNHPNFQDALWENPGEMGLDSKGRDKRFNGIDDDDNGFVDDFHGWNFVSNTNDIKDEHGHGTHIAGIIEQEVQSQRRQPSALFRPVRLMILKYFNPNAKSDENLKNSILAMKYAVKMNAHIINYSGGGAQQSELELQAIREAQKKSILLIAAAGNEGTNTDRFHYYPANYPLSNIISVAALDQNGRLLDFSNYGSKSVSVAAPGDHVFSSLPGGRYGVMSGTSQATARVTGIVASITSRSLEILSASEMIRCLLLSGQHEPLLEGKTKFSLSIGKLTGKRTGKIADKNSDSLMARQASNPN